MLTLTVTSPAGHVVSHTSDDAVSILQVAQGFVALGGTNLELNKTPLDVSILDDLEKIFSNI